MTKSPETEIAVLKKQTEIFDRDLGEVKTTLSSMDSKLEEIKTLLSEQYVTKAEFEGFKRSQNLQKIIVGVVTTVITAFVTFEVMRLTK